MRNQTVFSLEIEKNNLLLKFLHTLAFSTLFGYIFGDSMWDFFY